MNELLIEDMDIAHLIIQESKRQVEGLELIASENFVSPAIRQAQGTVFTHKYAEGYPHKRYYGGCEYVDIVEDLAISRVCEIFGAEYANVQPHSGSQANMASFFSCLNLGDKILGMNLAHGGHLTHGSPVNFSGRFFNFVSYGLNPDTEMLDYDEILKIAKQEKPVMIIAGASAYSRYIDFKRFRAIADEVGAILLVDMAHIAGLVAAGLHPNPVGEADIITSTTHKTLRGPRGGLILSNQERAKALNSQIFPGIQGGPLMHVIAAKAVCFGEALQPEFKLYQKQVLANAQILAQDIMDAGYKVVSGGTDNHLILINLKDTDITGKDAEVALEKACITVNKNTVPFDTRSPMVTSGVRIGTPALTSRGMIEKDMHQIATWIIDALKFRDNEAKLADIRKAVNSFARGFPLYARTTK